MKKLRRLRKGLAMLLSLAMVVGLIPGLGTVKVSAEESTATTSSTVTFTATAGTAGVSDAEEYGKLIDGKYSATDSNDYSKWCVTSFSSSSGAYIIFAASQAISVKGYTIVTGNDTASNSGRNPKDWTLYGCNDESANAAAGRDSESWELIHSVENDTTLEDKNYASYYFGRDTLTATKYQYFKLEINAIRSGRIMQMSEFILAYNTCEHNPGTTVGTIPPTCTEGGYNVQECSKCNEKIPVKNDIDMPATGHTWVDEVVVAPTCTKAGSTRKKCSVCGAEGETKATVALGHDFNDYGICNRCKASNIEPSKPSVGEGTAASPYEISTFEELYWFAGLVNGTLEGENKNKSACARLTGDITVNSNVLNSEGDLASDTSSFKSWTPIGSSDNIYTGTFNGSGHTIKGLYYNDESAYYVGLFGYVGVNGNISNVNIEDSYFKGCQIVGAVCGKADNSCIIQNCNNVGSLVECTTYFVGGICGAGGESGCTIKNCYNTGTVIGINDAGGVVGSLGANSIIENCHNTGTVSCTGYNGGGVVGSLGENSIIENCYNTGAVNSTGEKAGGVLGSVNKGTIRNCYNTGAVNGSKFVGGVGGKVGDKAIVRNCYNTGAVKGSDYVGGVGGQLTTGTIRYCYNTGSINWSGANAGGVCGGYYYNADNDEISNCYYLDTACPTGKKFDFNKGESKTAVEFASGEVCYLLNKSTIEGNLVWYQTLGTDNSPKFEGRIVYYNENYNEYRNCCEEGSHTYGDTTEHVDAVCLEAGYSKQTCSICGYVKKTYDEDGCTYHATLNGATCDKCGRSDPTVKQPQKNAAGTYQISTAGELLWFAKNSSGRSYNAELTCDIRLGILTDEGSIDYNGNNIEWTPIGKHSSYGDSSYKGQFNGNGHSVSGLYNSDNQLHVGLFGNNKGVVENVCVEDSYFSNSQYVGDATVGGICGSNSGTIRNCYNLSEVLLSKKIIIKEYNSYAGGICGKNSGTIENCYNRGVVRSLVSTNNYLGGICGYGSSKNSYYLEGCLSRAQGTLNSNDGVKTTAQTFADGSIAYALQGKQSSNIWGQKLGNDKFPVLIASDTSADAKRVYRFCNGTSISFSNTQSTDTHNLSGDGICQTCGGYEVPESLDGKYQISKKGHLLWFADHVIMENNNVNAILTKDIAINEGDVENCNGTPGEGWITWNPIGNETKPYIGTFDGNNHEVTGLYGNGGLFGYLGENGKISGVTVDNSYITGSKVGSICGYNYKGTIENCTNGGTVSGDENVGGVCGYSQNGIINNCSNNGSVSGKGCYGGVCGCCVGNSIIEDCRNTGAVSHRTTYTGYEVGGVCGYINGTINNCSNSGAVTENGHEVGGVCGYINGTINNCSNSGTVKVENGYSGYSVGGVCGELYGEYSAMNYCYNTGTVNCNDNITKVGGLCGYVDDGRIENCYNKGSVSGKDSVGGVCGENNSKQFYQNNYVYNCFNTGNVSGNEGSTKIGGVCGYNDYSMFKCCYYAEETAAKAIGESTDTAIEYNNISISSDQISNGELCYLLNKAIGDDTQLWRQTIGTDDTPNFEGKIVIFSEGSSPQYSNTGYCKDGEHNFSNTSEVSATCTSRAYSIKQCQNCNYQELTYKGEFASHNYNDSTKKCIVCGISKPALTPPQTDSEGVYQIGTAGELLWFAGLVNGTLENVPQNQSAKAVLTDDIIVGTLEEDGSGSYDYYHNKVTWTPIGNGSTNNYQYKGTFDGQGHSISGLYFNDETVDYVGLFGYAYNANISNVVIKDSYIKGKDKVGGVCGYNDGKLSNVGIEDSYIEGNNKVGGVCGEYDSSKNGITNCYNTSAVSGNMYVGGVCGYIGSNSNITNCYNTGDVSANIDVGGVCGYIYRSNINNCHNTGVIRGKYKTGAIGGDLLSGATVNSSYYLADCNAYGTGFDSTYGELKTIEQFTGGEVAYKLQSECYDEQVWGQDLSNKKSLPMLSSDTTYKVYIGCGTEKTTYSNDANVQGHRYNAVGICSSCGEYEEPVWDETNTVYKISTKGNLLWFAKYINKGNTEKVNAVLQNDITLNDGDVAGCNGNRQEGWIDWTPIGNAECIYYGTFDGNGHSISGLYFNDTNTTYVGLFGRTGAYSCVKNVGVENSYLKGKSIVGGVIGCMALTMVDSSYWETGSMENCYNTGTVFGISSKDFASNNSGVGGVCGFSYGVIKNCYNLGDVGGQSVDGDIYIGGVCGTKTRNGITNCYNAGKVTAKNEGVTINSICYSYSGSTATNCYYLNDEECSTDAGDGKTAAQFASGEVAYLLSQGNGGSVWRQDLGSAETTWPSLCGNMVYRYCEEGVFKYANKQHEDKHVFNKDGLCDCCGAAEEPVSVEGVYQIKNKGNLTWFANYVNGGKTDVKAVLTDDIDFSGSTFTSIGTSGNYFAGTFDGQGHTITVDQKDSGNVAIFGYIGGCTISNLTVTGTITTTVRYAAGIARQTIDSNRTYINNCISDVTIISVMGTEENHSAGYHGGIIGQAGGYVCITNCAFTGEISGSNTHSCAGIIGTASRSVAIENCYVSAEFNIDTSECSTYLWSSYDYSLYTLYNCYCIKHIGTIIGSSKEMTREQFASGEVAYLLSEGNTDSVWGQKLGTDGDAYPILKKSGDEGNTVYHYTNCANATDYTNDSTLSGNKQDHDYSAETVSDTAKKSDATCTEKAKYYYSCTHCGAVENNGEHVFENGDLLSHNDSDNDGKCDNCPEIIAAYTYLQTLISHAEAITGEDYSDASCQILQDAIVAAKVFTNDNSKEELTAACNELDNVIKSLKTVKTTVVVSCDPANSGILTGGGKYAVGEVITLTAKAVSGYKFLGWYQATAGENGTWSIDENSTLLSNNTTYEVNVTDETEAALGYIAKYESNEKNKLSITVGNGNVAYSYQDGKVNGTWSNDITDNEFAKGTHFTLTAQPNEGYIFLYWVNSAGRVLTESDTYSFYLGDDLKLEARYKIAVENKHYVIFKDMNGKILWSGDVDMDKTEPDEESKYGEVALPSHGIFAGYNFSCWKDASGKVITPDNNGYIKITEDIVIYADYEAVTGLTLTVDGQSQETNYAYASKVTVTADESKNGKYFSGWYIGDKLVSDSREYTFYITEDTSLIAKYEGTEVIVQEPRVNMTMSDRTALGNDEQTLVMTVTWSVPEGYSFVEGGLVRTLADDYSDKLTLSDVDGTNVKKNVSKLTTSEGTYAYTLRLTPDYINKSVYAVGYITYKNDATGNVDTVYTGKFTSPAVNSES